MFLTMTIITVLLFACASFFSIVSIYSDDERSRRITAIAVFSALVSFIMLGAARIILFFEASFVGVVSSIWGYFYIFSTLLMLTVLYLYFSRWKKHWKAFVALTAPFITALLIMSIPFIESTRRVSAIWYTDGPIANMLPAHILLSFTGELFYFFSFIGSILYLLMERQLRNRTSLRIIARLPNLETIENFNVWAISRALALISGGLLLGVIMTVLSYHTLFKGTAKETHIYFSWLTILSVFIMRRMKRISSRTMCIMNIVMFAIIMFLYIFTNVYIIKGFHGFK